MKLDLVIPYLLTLPSATDVHPSCHMLETWLARSEQTPAVTNYPAQLFSLLDLPDDLSSAWLSGLADDCEPAFMQWRADPVHFQARTDHAVLLDSNSLSIEPHEAEQLNACFNTHFMAEGFQLYSRNPQRWYLKCQRPLNVKTTPLVQAIGRNARLFMPTGDDALRWRTLLNETQMLFHAHAVNERRTDNGQLTINSLWLWGEGNQIPGEVKQDVTVFANEIVARGVAELTKTASRPVEDWLQNPAPGLLVLDDLITASSYGDVDAWIKAADALCKKILPVTLNALKTGRISQINLYPADGRCFTLRTTDLYKIWRWRKPLKHWLKYDS